jgi:hypothetical protein
MSKSPETGLDLDDLELQFLPAWAKESPEVNRYAKFEGGGAGASARQREERTPRPRREAPYGDRRRAPGDRPEQRRRPEGRRGGPPRQEERREPATPLPEVGVSFVPEEKGVESIARQIRLTGRAYPIFGIGHLILKKPDRYRVSFNVVQKPDGKVAQPLWLCNLDDTLWLSEQDAVNHVLNRHFDTFYQTVKTPTDPPKGTYTFVAQCGLSGEVLGPPNYHDYQNKLRRLHAERFARMPFEMYKSKVKIVKDEAVVKKWTEDQSWKTEYLCLNVPEPKTLANREEVDRHFREVHLANIIRTVESHTLGGATAQQLPTPALRQLLRKAWDEQMRFPIRVVNALSQEFALHGLQFFKVNKTVTHVAVARPHYLDLAATPVSDGVKRIVEYIDANSGCTRRQLIEALAPTPAATPPATGATPAGAPAPIRAPPGEMGEPTPEQTAVNADLHWLIHQGHVLEFANGKIETAKKPSPRPPKPQPKTAETAGDPTAPAAVATETAPLPPAQEAIGNGGAAESRESAAPMSDLSEAPADKPADAAPASGPNPGDERTSAETGTERV